MFEITNSKIGFKRYAGFSLLFDNPNENNLVATGNDKNIKKLRCSVNESGSKLYAGIESGLEKIGIKKLQDEYLFFQLPEYSYHVTVWDGLNEGNKEKISAEYRSEIEDFLIRLPFSLTQNYEVTAFADSSVLVGNKWNMTFKFERLSVWGNSVIVARLEPADELSENTLEQIKKERTELYKKYEDELGLESKAWRSGYQPHISIGYFGNEEKGKQAKSEKDVWTKTVSDSIGNSTISFNSISLYGFTDMESFFKTA